MIGLESNPINANMYSRDETSPPKHCSGRTWVVRDVNNHQKFRKNKSKENSNQQVLDQMSKTKS